MQTPDYSKLFYLFEGVTGVRVICSYIDDTYLIKDLLLAQDDIKIIRLSDYIRTPKPNGYRSLYLIVTVPVFMTTSVEEVYVEVQIRTIAMDFWASLEHELAYKLDKVQQESVSNELKSCGVEIADLDGRMQRPNRILASAMNIGSLEDYQRIRQEFDPNVLSDLLKNAEPGGFQNGHGLSGTGYSTLSM